MDINFNKSADQLIPAIIQDAETNRVLMLGYMNQEALSITQQTNKVTFFSRSKNRLWTKGESSGNFLHVQEIIPDCDQDTLLIKVKPVGPACHTGNDTCFSEKNEPDTLTKLEQTIQARKQTPDLNSYTSSLLSGSVNKVAQKVGEEAVELVIEAMDNNEQLFKEEAADLLFHYLVLLAYKNLTLNDIKQILQKRMKL